MKYNRLWAVGLVALFGIFSCTRAEEDSAVLDAPGFFTLKVNSADMETRSSGEDETDYDAIENTIDHFDFFFFKDEAGTEPFNGLHARVTGNSTQLDCREGKAFEAIRKGDSYVYVLANYDGAEADLHAGNKTLAQILALPVNAQLLTDATVRTLCETFVMDSYNSETGKYTVKLTPQSFQEDRRQTVYLTRLAAKLSLNITLKESVTTVDGNGNTETWTPIGKEMQVSLMNSLNKGTTVSAEPLEYEETLGETNFIDYPVSRRLTGMPVEFFVQPKEEGQDEGFEWVSWPSYTYPVTWDASDNGTPYFKIILPWMSDKKGNNNFYYKVVVPKPVSGVWTIERNKWYQANITVSVLGGTENEYVEVKDYDFTVANWCENGWEGGSGMSAARFFKVSKTDYVMYSQDELTIPFSSSSNVSAYFKSISYKHYGPVGTADVNTHYDYSYVNSASAPVTSITLSERPENYSPTPSGRTADVNKFRSSADDKNVYSLSVDNNAKNVTFHHNLRKVGTSGSDIYTVREIVLVIKNAYGQEAEVTIHQHPAIEIQQKDTETGFVNGYFARGEEDVMDVPREHYVGTEYGPTQYFDKGNYKYHSTSWWDGTYHRIENASSPFYYSSGGIGSIYGDYNGSVFAGRLIMLDVSVSAFAEGANTYKVNYVHRDADWGTGEQTKAYRIGDPRTRAGDQYDTYGLPPYLYSDRTRRNGAENLTADETREWEEPLNIMIAASGNDNRQVIAPRILLSSAMNITTGLYSLKDANRRASTYQEGGYPAGRWRLPTEAEIIFMVSRQKEGAIPEVFDDASTYWCADGRCLQIPSGDVVQSKSVTNGKITGTNTKVYIRLVYDLWYWGDTPMEKNSYHPNMHLEN